MQTYAKRGLSLLLACLFLLMPVASAETAADDTAQTPTVETAPETGADNDAAAGSDDNAADVEAPDYVEYLGAISDGTAGVGEQTLAPTGVSLSDVEGKQAVTLTDDGTVVNFRFDITATGWYRPAVVYYPVSTGSALDLNMAFTLDGAVPFSEADTVWLPRTYVNGEIKQDAAGNDLRPSQLEAPQWMTAPFWDDSGYNPDPFALYLEPGSHTLTLEVTQGTLALHAVTLAPTETLPSYAEVLAGYKDKGYTSANDIKELQAELADRKSGSTLYPDTNRANAGTTPSDPSYTRLNVITSTEPGDWLEWDVQVEKSGLYQIGMRVLQDGNRGMVSTRRLYINGEIPFAEAQYVEFPYSTSWYNYTLGGEETPWQFYFEAGQTYTLRLEITTGRFAETLHTLQEAVKDLNVLCRRITMVTGLSPDIYRDYNYEAEIPDLKNQLTYNRDLLKAELDRLSGQMDTAGSALTTVEDILRQLELFIENDRKIASNLNNFRTNISTLGTWILSMTAQKVTMDTLVLYSEEQEMRSASAGFFTQLVYDVKALIGSFLIDYNSIGTTGGGTAGNVTVWTSAGRDQANILRRLIDDDFSSKTDIGVHLSLVGDSGTLLQATLAGKGPDVALFVDKTLPVNLAARNAIEDLSTYEGFDAITERFYPSALVPYEFEGGTWALPCAQGFSVMFIRTDIFEELGIAIPNTWDDIYKLLPIIQRENMEVGLGGGAQAMFETLILQNGGEFYTEDQSAVAFDTPEVLNAFKMWTSFYTEYGAAQTYDAFNYFRSGVMPLLITDYTLYNQLAVAAPEIRGLWTITPIPGVLQEDGTINRTESATGSAAIIMKDADDKQSAFKFLDWWTTVPVQTRYSLELEATMGPAARYNSATAETIGNLAWSREEYAAIVSQWDQVWDIPSIPSGYYVTRNVTNAFRRVVYQLENEREVLNHYGAIINKEITRKNKELGITGKGEQE